MTKRHWPGRLSRGSWGWTVLLVPLLALAAAGREHVPSTPITALQVRSHSAQIALVTMTIAAALVAVVIAAHIRRRRRPDDSFQNLARWQPSRGSQLVAVLIALAVVAVLVAIATAAPRGNRPYPVPRPIGRPPSGSKAPTRSGHAGSASSLDATQAGLILAAAAMAIALWLLARHRIARSAVVAAPIEPPGAVAQIVERGLREAAAELDAVDDVRRAIADCYRTMRRRWAAAGLTGGPADTPRELLGAAVDRGLVAPAPATELTRLFEQARFSTAPLTEAHRDAARSAVQALRAVQVSP